MESCKSGGDCSINAASQSFTSVGRQLSKEVKTCKVRKPGSELGQLAHFGTIFFQ